MNGEFDSEKEILFTQANAYAEAARGAMAAERVVLVTEKLEVVEDDDSAGVDCINFLAYSDRDENRPNVNIMRDITYAMLRASQAVLATMNMQVKVHCPDGEVYDVSSAIKKVDAHEMPKAN